MREIILDTETTGLDPGSGHRVIEIGMIEMIDKIVTGEKFHYYINPERDVPLDAYRIHGISTEFLRDKPLFKDISEELLDFISDSRLVIHNAAFDMKFINHELSLVDMPSLDMSNVIDTVALARKKFPGAKVNLDALCKKFKIDNSARNFHGALLDAKILSEVYLELVGGRQSKFLISSDSPKNLYVLDSKNHLNQNLKTPILEPTEDELLAHEELLKKIPNNLW